MANSFDLITKYSAENLDEIFRKGSVTSILGQNQALFNFVNAKTYDSDMVLSQLGR